jgi:hypothetical protein
MDYLTLNFILYITYSEHETNLRGEVKTKAKAIS